MAKIRVFELAKDLNLKNKALLDKLEELHITVASHLSSLEDDVVEQVRAAVLGRQAKVVEETRVRPTVIRRRKKVVEVEAVEVEIQAEAEAETEAEAAPLPESAVPPPEPPPSLPVEEPEPIVTAAVEIAATVEPLAAPAVEPASSEPPVLQAAVPEEVRAQPETEPESPALEQAASAPALEAPQEPGPATGAPVAAPEGEAPAEVMLRKAKRETPARIIKLGEVRPSRPAPAARVIQPRDEARAAREGVGKTLRPFGGSPETPAPATAAAADARSAVKGKTKGRKDRPGEEGVDKNFFKKKISFRKKEVVEGADLYGRALRMKKARKTGKGRELPAAQKTQITTAKAIKRRIKVDDTIVLAELGKRMGIKAGDMIRKLMAMGVMATVNQTIDFETAALVATEFDYELERAAFEEDTLLKPVQEDAPETLQERPPVVTIMGHVDHGKTSLLDAIRRTRVTEGEAGGITQHIGAYHVATEKGRIVFLDTPGHEAFTAMRSRGASVTDIVVLVVAADDGVMPQTIEAINHSRAAGVPIIVAVNKIDKPGADPERVQRELADKGLVDEAWGGDTIFVRVSAKQRVGLNDLLEMILLQAEVMELKANPAKLASGHVVEAKLDSGRGAVATVLVQEGTLRTGDPVVCGVHYGKVRAMLDDCGVPVESAGPSMPVEIIGLSGVPNAGDEIIALADEKNAKQVSMHRMQKQRSKELAKTSRLSLETLFEQMKEGEVKDLNIILKADVHGSIEALRDSLLKLSNPEVKINLVHAATGTITESDVSLAGVSRAIIIGFNVRPNTKVQAMAQEENVDIRYYNIIYNVIKDVQDAILGMMASTFEERVMGRAEVRQVFLVPRVGAIAGCGVTDGKVQRGLPARLLRDGVVVYEGKIGSLRRYKDDVREVLAGYECGIGIENFNDIKVGDVIECYFMEEIKPSLTDKEGGER
jgi:translation initiation factor IF-2